MAYIDGIEPIDPSQPILTITPGELIIPLVLNQDVVVELSLQNNTSSKVAYKIKTTAPDKYQVRPIQAVIAPHAKAVCMIVMRPISTMPSAEDQKNLKHKFLIQSAQLPDDTTIDADNLQDAWRDIEAEKKNGRVLYHDARILSNLQLPSPLQPCQQCPQWKQKLEVKEVEFNKLMDFSVKQSQQSKTHSAQLQQKDRDLVEIRQKNQELEKEIVELNGQLASQLNTAPTLVEDPNVPFFKKTQKLPNFVLALLVLLGLIIGFFLRGGRSVAEQE